MKVMALKQLQKESPNLYDPIAIDMASRRLWLFEAQTAAKARVEPTDAPKPAVKPTPAVEPAK